MLKKEVFLSIVLTLLSLNFVFGSSGINPLAIVNEMSPVIYKSKKFNRGIPNDAHQKITSWARYGISAFTFSPNGGWLIATRDGKFYGTNIPAKCNDQAKYLIRTGHKIRQVAFTPKGGFVIVTDKTIFSRNIPNDCYQILKKYQGRRKKIAQVHFTKNNGWLILKQNGGFHHKNIDDECVQVLENYQQRAYANSMVRPVHNVVFHPVKGFAIFAGQYEFIRYIDANSKKYILSFQKKRDQVDILAYTPNGRGFSIISNNRSSSRKNRIRNFEESFANGKQNIWDRMQALKVPGLSVAVVVNGKIQWSAGYGHLKYRDRRYAVHPNSIFQAASVSKVVAAVGGYELTEQYQFGLDDNLLKGLLKYKIPIHPCLGNFKDNGSVTVRNILNHDSGIDGRGVSFGFWCRSVQEGGYSGYDHTTKAKKIPNLLQIMSGSGPAKTKPVRITYDNSKRNWTYSGPAFTTLQKLTEDLTRTSYTSWMQNSVLYPTGMRDSKFTVEPARHYPANRLTWGYDKDDKKVVRNKYPEYAAAGLYTSAEDLAKLIIMINNDGGVGPYNTQVISRTNAQLLKGGTGINQVDGSITARSSYICHGGTNKGYRAYFIAFPNIQNDANGARSGGIIVMLNGSDDNFRNEVTNAIIRQYGW